MERKPEISELNDDKWLFKIIKPKFQRSEVLLMIDLIVYVLANPNTEVFRRPYLKIIGGRLYRALNRLGLKLPKEVVEEIEKLLELHKSHDDLRKEMMGVK